MRAAQIRGELTELVHGMDLDVISGADAAVLVREFSLIEKVAAAARTLAAARVAETSAWVREGDRSAEDWLSRQTGKSVGTAARDLRTGKRVKKQTKTQAAMRQGTLSPEQAGAVAEAVEVDPAAETTLIEAAKRETFKNLQDQARRTRAAATDDAERAKRHHRERSARTSTDAEGAFCLFLRGPASDGARILGVLKPLLEQAFRQARTDVSAATRDTFDNRTYDAVLTMLLGNAAPSARPAPAAPHCPATTNTSSTGSTGSGAAGAANSASKNTDPTGPAPNSASTNTVPPSSTDAPSASPMSEHTSPHPNPQGPTNEQPLTDPGRSSPPSAAPPDQTGPPDPSETPDQAVPPDSAGAQEQSVTPNPMPPPTKLPGGNNVKVIVRVDLDALLRGHTVAGETSEIAGLGPVPVAVVREMMDDAFLAVVVRKGRDVVSVAHHGRGLNVHQRTAIEAQGPRCSNVACNQTIGIQVDHRHPWVKDKVTKLDNQGPLCGPCHRRKTHEGWHLESGTGPRRFLPPARAG